MLADRGFSNAGTALQHEQWILTGLSYGLALTVVELHVVFGHFVPWLFAQCHCGKLFLDKLFNIRVLEQCHIILMLGDRPRRTDAGKTCHESATRHPVVASLGHVAFDSVNGLVPGPTFVVDRYAQVLSGSLGHLDTTRMFGRLDEILSGLALVRKRIVLTVIDDTERVNAQKR